MNSVDPIKACEEVLKNIKKYNLENGICSKENKVIDYFLERHLELHDAYGELCDKLYSHREALNEFFDCLIRTATYWNPDRVAEDRGKRIELVEINKTITKKAFEIAELLDERTEISNKSGFYSDTHYHICDLIELAAKDNYSFGAWVKNDLHHLRSRFDMKYWPSISDCIRVIGEDAEAADIQPSNRLTAAATTGVRGSKTDFFKALFKALDDSSIANRGFLPSNFRLSDGTLAALASCALNLRPDDLLDATYVKRLRQRRRETNK